MMIEPLALGVMTHFQDSPAASLAAVRDLDIPTVQLLYPSECDTPTGIAALESARRESGIEITTVFCFFEGESYASIPIVRETVGLVPEATRAQRVAHIETISRFAQKIGVARVAAHIGFIPEDAGDARYPALVATIQTVCDDVARRGQRFALETGQETAATLRRFVGDVKRPNLRVNFDPANMILYGNDEPIPALDLLAPWVDGVHCKDGKWPTEAGQLGREMPLGEGDVNVSRWIEKLLEIGYRGPLTIEREISGEEQKQDILRAKTLLEMYLAHSD